MTEYLVAPLEEPDWAVGAEELAAGLVDRWPGVRVSLRVVEGSSMGLEALIPLPSGPRELGVALSDSGQMVTLEPADAEAAAEFAVWYFGRFLVGRTGVHLIEPAMMRMVELTDGMTAGMLLERFTQMSDSDEIFLAVDGGVDGIAGRVAEVLGVRGEGRRDDEGEWQYVGEGRTVDAPYRLVVGVNYLAPSAGVLQAMDGYPVMVDVELRTHKALQAEDARLAFEVIVGGLPEVPALLLHNAEWLVAAYLPGRSVRYFESGLTPDAEDVDTWGSWVVGWNKEK